MNEIIVNHDGIMVTYENDQMLVSSLEVSRNFQKEHRHVLESIRNLAAENSVAKKLFYESTYENRGKQYPMYLMNRDGFTLLAMGFTGKDALEWKLKYIQAFNEMEAKLNDPDFLVKRSMEYLEKRCQALLLENSKLDKKVAELNEEVSYKEDVIINLVDGVSLSNKRDILNRVVRRNGANYRERWSAIYREFENKYHIDLKRRLDTYNKSNRPKMRNKLDYVEKVMGKLPELYEIACKLYETDVKELVQEMYDLNGENMIAPIS